MKLAEVWRDPITNVAPSNPWAKDSINLTEQSWLAAHEPELANYLRATKDGVTHTYLQKQREEQEGRAVLRKLSYGEAEHRQNPFHDNSDLAARGRFGKEHHPAITAFYKREAAEPVVLPWQGEGQQTDLGQLARHAPALRELVRETSEAEILRKRWIAEQLLNR